MIPLAAYLNRIVSGLSVWETQNHLELTYQIAILSGCSSRRQKLEVMRMNPGFKQDSKTPRRNLTAANEPNEVHAPVQVRVIPHRTKLTEMYRPVGHLCIKMFVGY